MGDIRKIVIIGAGPSGLFTGYNLKKLNKNLDVTIYEEHSHLKKTCSGIFTENINEIIKIPESKKDKIIINKISKAKILAPNNEFLKINFKKSDIVVDREKFSEYLKHLAEKEGCKIITDARFEGIDFDNNILVKRKHKTGTKEQTEKISADILIGADGALSNVAKSAGLWNNKERVFYLGVKAKVSIDETEIIFYPYIKNFAWVLPLKKGVCEIGIAKKMNANANINVEFEKFIKLLEKKFKKKISFSQKESALIPEYKKIKMHKKMKSKTSQMDVYLVGDSALQVKATTLGGVIPNLKAAKILAESIAKKQNYEFNLNKLNLELLIHKKLRNTMNKFSDGDWNKLIKDFNNPKLIKILNETSRDEPKKLALKLFKAKPSLIKYGKFLI